MRAKPDGFELTFTKPIDPKTAGEFALHEEIRVFLGFVGGYNFLSGRRSS